MAPDEGASDAPPRGAPLVSVILPTYDRPDMLAEAVESVASQRYDAIELLVVDDASDTPVEDAVAAAAGPELRWRYLRHARNRGANAARNTGIDAASGEVLAFLDDDDRWHPEKVGAQVVAFQEAGEDVGVVLVGQQFVNGDQETTTRFPDLGRNATPDLLTGRVGGSFSTIAVRRRVVDAAGRPDERLPAWQDREWLLRLSDHCEFATIRRPLVYRRLGEYDQIGDRFEPKRDVTYPLFVEKHADLAAEHGLERSFRAHLLVNLAKAGLANGYYRDARRLAARAVRNRPGLASAYLLLALALGGPYTYTAAVRLKRLLT